MNPLCILCVIHFFFPFNKFHMLPLGMLTVLKVIAEAEIKFYNVITAIALLCGVELLAVLKADVNKINAAEVTFLRLIKGR